MGFFLLIIADTADCCLLKSKKKKKKTVFEQLAVNQQQNVYVVFLAWGSSLLTFCYTQHLDSAHTQLHEYTEINS